MRTLTLLLLFFISTFTYASVEATSPVGYWKTIDDVTGVKRSIMKLWVSNDNKLYGQVVKTFPLPDEEPNRRCTACQDANKDKPILGMVIMTGLTFNKSQWDGGKILDPLNGKKYKCSVRVVDDGTKLIVRGYIGLPLLGRSQTWIRVNGLNG